VIAATKGTRIAMTASPSIDNPSYRSFLVRLWVEPESKGAMWRGEVEYIQSGLIIAVSSLEEAFAIIQRTQATGIAQDDEDRSPSSL
jgi:hypothetical protein